jgi:MFS family permease
VSPIARQFAANRPGALARRTFRALRIHNYRLFFISQIVSMSGTWMQGVAQAWLVLQLTGSGLDLGITVGLQFGPVLVLGAWAGALADRVDKRRLLMATQTAAAVFALILAALTFTDVATVWMIWVLAGLTGVAVALDLPSRQSFVYEMVGPDDLANAVGLNAVIINSSRIVGPAIGGLLIAAVGVAPCFLFNAVSYIAVIVALAVMRTAELRPSKPVRRQPGQVREGLSYVWRTPELRIPLVMLAVVSTLAYNYSVVLPLLTKEVAPSPRPWAWVRWPAPCSWPAGRALRGACSWPAPSPSAWSRCSSQSRPAMCGAWCFSSRWERPACSSSAPSTRCFSSTPTTPCAVA